MPWTGGDPPAAVVLDDYPHCAADKSVLVLGCDCLQKETDMSRRFVLHILGHAGELFCLAHTRYLAAATTGASTLMPYAHDACASHGAMQYHAAASWVV